MSSFEVARLWGWLLIVYAVNDGAHAVRIPRSNFKSCSEKPLELREEMANVVLSGYIDRVMRQPRKLMYDCEVHVVRVFKGQTTLSNEVLPAMTGNKVKISGFGDPIICDNVVHPGDTRVMLLNKDSNGHLKLNSSLIRITLGNLDRAEAAVSDITNNDIPYITRKPVTEGPCSMHLCAYGAICQESEQRRPLCVCPDVCTDVFSPVCGSDDITYMNECHLKSASCTRMKRIMVEMEGPCDSSNPCDTKECSFGAECMLTPDRTMGKCVCPQDCEGMALNSICGSDGVDYINDCELRRASCLERRDVEVIYFGYCDPCEGVEFDAAICKLDFQRRATASCFSLCMDEDVSPICSSDGNTYDNDCAMQRAACIRGVELSVYKLGECELGAHPCEKFLCEFGECLVNDDGEPSCICGPECPEVYHPVCGSDGKTYFSICHMVAHSCNIKTTIEVKEMSPCASDLEDACDKALCLYGAMCMVEGGKAMCTCDMMCTLDVAPVCGSDGMTYSNACQLKQVACEQQDAIMVKYEGPCETCDSTPCTFGAICEMSSLGPKCICTEGCVQFESPVCGSDGITHDNECQLVVKSCMLQEEIYVVSQGSCEECEGVFCEFGSMCNRGSCVCPACAEIYDPVCSTDMITYASPCHLQAAMCNQRMKVNVLYVGECDDMSEISGSGLGSGNGGLEGSGELPLTEKCDETTCGYGGTCIELQNGISYCSCSMNCSATRKPVCSSDLMTYGSECIMREAMCEQKTTLTAVSFAACEDVEMEPCDGEMPLTDAEGLEFTCSEDETMPGCPSGSYCHIHPMGKFSVCCPEQTTPPTCADTAYGCCPDGITAAQGRHDAGCPSMCDCNELGSYSPICVPVSQQCPCKPGVGGKKCDRCEPGFWDLRGIQTGMCDCNELGSYSPICVPVSQQCPCKPGVGGKKCDRCEPGFWDLRGIQTGNSGCRPCACSKAGSVRDDCEQMFGQCICKSGVMGMKCDVCSAGMTMTSTGCVQGITEPKEPDTTCEESGCPFNADCQLVEGKPKCVCPSDCHPSFKPVCGSDGQTYASECQLRLFSCRLLQDFVIRSRGKCETSIPPPSTSMPTSTTSIPSPTTESVDCLTSKFGCCPDGVSEAMSPGGGGCPTETPGVSTPIPIFDATNEFTETMVTPLTHGSGDTSFVTETVEVTSYITITSDSDSVVTEEQDLTNFTSRYNQTGPPAEYQSQPMKHTTYSMKDITKPKKATTEPWDPTAEYSGATIEPDDATPEPRGARTEPRGATPELRGATTEPWDLAAEYSGATLELNDATPEPRGATTEPIGATTEPMGATTEPMGATTELWDPAAEYSGATPEPNDATPEPNDATPEPRDATTEPRGATTEPRDATTEPRGATTEPRGATPKPRVATTESRDATTEPRGATTEPWSATPEPRGATTEPRSVTTEPRSVPTKLTGVTTELSDAKTNLPDATTEPMNATTKHKDSTIVPRDATTEPSNATAEPRDARDNATELMHDTSDTAIPTAQAVLALTMAAVSTPMQVLESLSTMVSTTEEPAINVLGCASDPCLHGGTCLDHDDMPGFLCSCPLGKGGPVCDQDVYFDVPSFMERSYLAFPKMSAYFEVEIIMKFKMESDKDALLLWNGQDGQSNGDFISLALIDGFVEFRFDPGTDEPVIIRSVVPIKPYQVYQVNASRSRRDGKLSVDDEPEVAGSSNGRSSGLSLSTDLHIGSGPPEFKEKVYHQTGIDQGLIGCVHELEINNRPFILMYPGGDMLYGANVGQCDSDPCLINPCVNNGTCEARTPTVFVCLCINNFIGPLCGDVFADQCEGNMCHHTAECVPLPEGSYRCDCPTGRKGELCDHVMETTFIPSFNGISYIELPTIEGEEAITVKLDMLAKAPNGMVFYNGDRAEIDGDFISLNLEDGYLDFRFDLGSGPSEIRSVDRLSLQEWHTVEVTRVGKDGMMIIDGGRPVTGESQGVSENMNLDTNFFLGGTRNYTQLSRKAGITDGLQGAIKRLTVNDRMMHDFVNGAINKINIEEFVETVCEGQPCLETYDCRAVGNTYVCECPENYEDLGNQCIIADDGSGEGSGDFTTPSTPPCNCSNATTVSSVTTVTSVTTSHPVPVSLGLKTSLESSPRDNSDNTTKCYCGKSPPDFPIKKFPQQNFMAAELPFPNTRRLGENDMFVTDIITEEMIPDSPQKVTKAPPVELGRTMAKSTPKMSSARIVMSTQISKETTARKSTAKVTKMKEPTLRQTTRRITTLLHTDLLTTPLPTDLVTTTPIKAMTTAPPVDIDAPVLFDGASYYSYPNIATQQKNAQMTNMIKVTFRTRNLEGMLLYNGVGPAPKMGDFIFIAVDEGELIFGFNLGSGFKRIDSGFYVADYDWHTVRITRTQRDASLQVDQEEPVIGSSKPGASQLNTDGVLWIGGYDSYPDNVYPQYRNMFEGCIKKVKLDENSLHLYHDALMEQPKQFCPDN